MADERVTAERLRRLQPVADEKPEPVNDKPAVLSDNRLLVLACYVHNAWVEIRDDGQMAPKPGTLQHLCPQCIAHRNPVRDERIVVDPALNYRPLADDLVVAKWRERHEARTGPRPDSLEEEEVLDQMDAARDEELREVERLRAGRRSRRRGYEPPAFRSSGVGWDTDDYPSTRR